jgi:hypothetical protein
MNKQEMSNVLLIYFTDDGWEKMRQTRELLIKMFKNKLFGAVLAPNLINNLSWFWNNKRQFKVRILKNGEEESFT